jgi:hypothetical protein
MWLSLAIASCLIVLLTAGRAPIYKPNSNGDSDRQYNTYDNNYNNYNNNNYNSNNNNNYNNTYGNYHHETTTRRLVPVELHFNFSLPENGLPPLKLNMGAVSQYLNEMSQKIASINGTSFPRKMKKTLLVKIKNPNKPFRPIPAEIFAAGLPKGAIIPGNVVKPCRSFIVSRCIALCKVQTISCSSLCDGRRDCLTSCETSLKTCSSFCDSTFSELDNQLKLAEKNLDDNRIGNTESVSRAPLLDEFKNEIPNVQFYLPKCLQNCGSNVTCITKCHHVCHGIWEKPSTQYDLQYSPAPMAFRPKAPRPIGSPAAAPPMNSQVGFGMREGEDFESKDNDEMQKDDTLDTE